MFGGDAPSLSPITAESLRKSNDLLQGDVSKEVIAMMADMDVSLKGNMLYQISTNEQLEDFQGCYSHHSDNHAIYLCIYQDAVTIPGQDERVLRIGGLNDANKYWYSDISRDAIGKVTVGEKKVVSRDELEKLGFSLPNSTRTAVDVTPQALAEDFNLVSPGELKELLDKFHHNIVLADTPEAQAQEMQNKRDFAQKATKFMEQGGTIIITIDGREVKVGKVKYLPTLAEIVLYDESGMKMENRGNTTFTPKTASQVKASTEGAEEVMADSLAAEWNEILTSFNYREIQVPEGQPIDVFICSNEEALGKFIAKVEKFMKNGGKILWGDSVSVGQEIPVLGLKNLNKSLALYRDVGCQDLIELYGRSRDTVLTFKNPEASAEGTKDVTAEWLATEWEGIKSMAKITSNVIGDLELGGINVHEEQGTRKERLVSKIMDFIAQRGLVFVMKGGSKLSVNKVTYGAGDIIPYIDDVTQISGWDDIIFEDIERERLSPLDISLTVQDRGNELNVIARKTDYVVLNIQDYITSRLADGWRETEGTIQRLYALIQHHPEIVLDIQSIVDDINTMDIGEDRTKKALQYMTDLRRKYENK